MAISDGQSVDAANSNPAWISKNTDDTTPSKLGFANTDPISGPSVVNAQREFNSIATFLGKALNSVYNLLPTWTSNDAGASTDDVKTRSDALSAKFNLSTGHAHSGAAHDGALISAPNLANVPLKAYPIGGTNYTTTAAASDNVTTLMSGRTASGGSTSLGVVSTPSVNRTSIRSAATQMVIEDASGNTVYGRITFAAGVWTHSYFVLISGVETAYTFPSPKLISWTFQEIHNPMVDPPVYDSSFVLPSANATADVEPASTSLAGKVTLSSATPAAIAATGSAGTANGTVANADHTHAGVHKLTAAATDVLGDAQLAASGPGLSVGVVGQVITFAFSWLMAALGDMIYGGASGAPTVLSGNTTTTRKFLRQVGTGTASAAPAWDTLASGDLPTVALTGDVTGSAAGGSIPTTLAASGVTAGNYTNANITVDAKGRVTAASSGTAGGGGGGSLQWVEDGNSPTPLTENHNSVYAFASGLSQVLYALIKVPTTYAGAQIKLKTEFYDPDNSGTVLIQTVATLIRTGVDAITSTSNQRTSTNTALTLGVGTVNIPQALALDLTDGTGKINAVSVSAGDLILVAFQRGTDTGASDAKVPVYGAEVTFT